MTCNYFLVGYSIFVLSGELPPCDAEDILRLMPVVQREKPKLLSEVKSGAEKQSATSVDDFDDDLKKAIEESRHLDEDDDKTLKEALKQSMLGKYLCQTN